MNRTFIPRRARAFVAAALVALGLASATTAGAIDPIPTPEPPDPTPSVCMSQTVLNSFTASGGPFADGTTLTWSVARACPEVTIKLNGAVVAASGTKAVDPPTGTEYRLTASLGTSTKPLGARVALAADIVSYVQGRGGLAPIRNSTGEHELEAMTWTHDVLGSVSTAVKAKLLGKNLEVHLIPEHLSLTTLPLWRYLQGQEACGSGTCRPWSEVRGVGNSKSPLLPANTIAIAVGEEMMFRRSAPSGENGYTLVHELGHAVLIHGAPAEYANVEAARQASIARGRTSVILRNGYNKDEYFAEGTAALLDVSGSDLFTRGCTPDFLAEREPELLTILRRVYPGAS
jgi:hypothetical protein